MLRDLLAEQRGTLARTAQKKKTVLNQYAKFTREQEKAKKYGFASRPSDPLLVSSLPSAEHFLGEVRAEFAEKHARITNPDRVSVAVSGDAAVRALNDELNRLSRELGRWSRRVSQLGGAAASVATQRHHYFGAAKDLAEAADVAQKRPRERVPGDDDADDVDDAASNDALEALATSGSTSEVDDADDAEMVRPHLLLDGDAERALRREEALWQSGGLSAVGPLLKHYASASAPPTEEEVWAGVLERRRASIQARLKK